MSYTIKNLSEVEDSAPKFGFGERQEAHFAQGALDAEDTGFSYHIVKPDKRQGFAHRHDKAEEVYVVIGGAGRINLDGEVVETPAPRRHPRGAGGRTRVRSRPRRPGATRLRPAPRGGRRAHPRRRLAELIRTNVIARSASAVIVSDGLTPMLAGTTEPSQTSRFS